MSSGDVKIKLTLGQLENIEGLRPDVDEVALLLRTHTAGNIATGLGGDTGPGDLTTFTDTTRPSAAEAERVIDIAYANVTGELADLEGDYEIPEVQIGQIRHAIALYADILILSSFFKGEDAAIELFRELYSAAIRRVSAAINRTDRSGRMISATLTSPFSGDDLGTSGLDFAGL